ncbi:16S rRNA (cytidine(1402)-2'-O)-methyltransferase [Vallitalea pronyensis]|uniref:Ribosomal RNA small subunit methyltransferase I n=1 Tax=Vallitalea pronyensis TaxID=1348613 RepID=A0A8J8MGC5_9FIRM|nr:16S rRNA (cytidine(1402)-2'-O)-methyltransferase [Vallitalea pronyensis]QUI21064.1 16S rRNA (cytidine(1402)-2'-O)-methyltransferase [Vallitalea pronyensis]
MTGILYLVATPIGNLEDITYRAVRILEEADLIAAEDTRHTKKLLNHLGINKPLISYHEHNKMEKGQVLIEKLLAGDGIALVTDAGTPGISDPGEDLVKLCHDHNIPVTSIPGPVALITGLILSGLSTRRFVFEGFLPHDKKERKMVLEQLKDEHRTIILYEAPHRLKQTLLSIKDTLGNRQVSMTRELTKKFEEVLPMTLDEAIKKYSQEDPRGEYVLIVEGKSLESIRDDRIKQWESITIEEHMNQYMKENMSKKEAMKQVAKDRGTTKRAIYQYLIEPSE